MLIRYCLAAGLVLTGACAAKQPVVAPASTAVSSTPLIDQLLGYDATLPSSSELAESRAAFAAYVDRVAACPSSHDDPGGQRSCLLGLLLGPGGLEPVQRTGETWANTATHALVEGSGSCAALVAVALTLADEQGIPMEAVVLRDHVVLAAAESEGVYFEVLEGGRRLSQADVDRFRQPPDGPIRLSAEAFLPYYLDNLAARLAASGEVEKSDEFFRAALELAPDATRLNYNYGTFLVKQRQDAEALTHLDRAIQSGWDDADAWVNRGVALSRLERDKEARESFETALGLDPSNREARGNLRKISETQR